MAKQTDILSFNTVEVANKGDDLELFYKGASTGIFLHVLGKDSDEVKQYQTENSKTFARQSKFAEKKGKEVDFFVGLIDKLDERNIDNALVRITGWTGANGDYDTEKMRTALKNNPQWIDDVIEFSDNLGK